MIDEKELRKLPPKEREEALKRIIEERKKEKESLERIRKETYEELKRAKIIENIPVPEEKPVDISSLFTGEEKGLEASAVIEQIKDKDFFTDYNRVFEENGAQSISYNSISIISEESLEEASRLISDKYIPKSKSKEAVDKSTASVGIIEHIKNYKK